MKTHVPRVIFRLRAFVLMTHQRQTTYYRLYHHIVYFLSQLIHIQTTSTQLLKNTRETSLVTYPHVIGICIENELWIVFVYCVVRQMHILLVQITRGRLNIGLSGKSSQTLTKHIQSQRISPTKQHIYPEIEL